MTISSFISSVTSIEGQTLADAFDLLDKVFDMPREKIGSDPKEEIDSYKADEVLRRLKEGEPSAYICGTIDFAGVRVRVLPPLLIPRPETEQMVQEVIEDLKNRGVKPQRILDICTGTGCIGVALAKAFPEARVLGTDISAIALKTARRSAEDNQLTNIEFIKHNFLNGISERYDLLISNPPYIPLGDRVDAYLEDPLALFSGEDGLDAMRQIATRLFEVLNPSGLAVFEIYPGNARPVVDLLSDAAQKSEFQGYDISIRKDLSGKDRYVWIYLGPEKQD